MPVDDKIIICLKEVTDFMPATETDWHSSLTSLGMDSLEILDFLYNVEQKFGINKLSSGSLLNVKNLSLNDIRNKLISHNTSIAVS
jgi:acyl carrier protein